MSFRSVSWTCTESLSPSRKYQHSLAASDGVVTGMLTESGALGTKVDGASTGRTFADGTTIDGVLRGGTPMEGMVTDNEGVSTGALTGSEGTAGEDTTLEGTPEGVLTIGAPLTGRLERASMGRLFEGIPTDGLIVGVVMGRPDGLVTGKPDGALMGRWVEGALTHREADRRRGHFAHRERSTMKIQVTWIEEYN